MNIEETIKNLIHHHKQATSLDKEYTPEIYDHLTEAGKMTLTREEKFTIFDIAKEMYKQELSDLMKVGNIDELKASGRAIKRMEADIPNADDKARIVEISKIISIKNYFDKLK